MLPTPQQLTELNDLLVSTTELYKLYASLERHPRIMGSPRSLELFSTFSDQLRQDISVLDKQLEILLSLARPQNESNTGGIPSTQASYGHTSETDAPSPFLSIPDVEPTDINKSVFETVKKAFQIEDVFSDQLNACLRSAQQYKHLKLELQLKMIILSSDQRYKLLEDRYGYAKTKNALFQGLQRQTTRFLSALSGENRTDIDQ
ncbi:MAG TPA: hypothetical protein VL981_08470 [Candidatus Methylacidiphilales bacterium]|nr:hypothetical protein [Candidatus Methylacidiphilales bacterium]